MKARQTLSFSIADSVFSGLRCVSAFSKNSFVVLKENTTLEQETSSLCGYAQVNPEAEISTLRREAVQATRDPFSPLII